MRESDSTPAALLRLTVHAQLAFSAQAERFEAAGGSGVWKIITGEPVADLNYLTVTGDSPTRSRRPSGTSQISIAGGSRSCAWSRRTSRRH